MLQSTTSERRRTRVVVADDSATISSRVATMLADSQDIEIVGFAACAASAIEVVRREEPDALVLDYRMPGGGGAAVLRALPESSHRPVVVVLTNYASEEYRLQSFSLGASAFLDKTADIERLPSMLAALMLIPRRVLNPLPVGEGAVLTAFAASMPDPFFVKDAAGRFVMANDAMCRLVGRELGDLIGLSNVDVLPADLAAMCTESDSRALAGESFTVSEVTGEGGETRHYRTTKFPVRDADGLIVGLGGMAKDVTLRCRAEAALASQLERFELVQRAVGEAMWEVSLESGDVWWSEEMYSLFGHSRAALRPSVDSWRSLLHAEDRDRVRAGFDTAVATGLTFWQERYRYRRGDGSWAWVADRCVVRRAGDGQALGVVGAMRDVTREVEDENVRERLSSILESTTDCVIIADLDGAITYVNTAGTRMLGRPAGAWAGLDLSAVHTGPALEHLLGTDLDSALRDGSWSGESVLRASDGSEIPVSVVVLMPRGADGLPSHVAIIARDIGPIRALQQQLFASEKLEIVGRLASGIAHDFNNILAAIRAFAGLLHDDLPADAASAREDLAEIELAVDRAQGLTGQLLTFGRPARQQAPARLSPGCAVREMERFLARIAGDAVTLSITVADPCHVIMDLSQFQQVVLNLVVNAREAMPEGGTLGIEVACTSAGADGSGGTTMAPGRYAVVSVSDSGAGLDPAAIQRIFEPFFTTKEHGTGLGLATVHQIATAVGGGVAVDSRPGAGATFRVYLPAADSTDAEAS